MTGVSVVLDTNILVSALLSPLGNPAKIYKMFLTENLKVVYSPKIIAEYSDVLFRPRLQIPTEEAAKVLEAIQEHGTLIEPVPSVHDMVDEADRMKYTKLYSGGEPELIEDDIFKTIIPLGSNVPVSVTDKLPIKVADKLTAGETAFLKSLESYLNEYEWITNAQAREITEKTEGSVKRFLRNLADKGALESRGENKHRQYRLRN
jgi:putative PIN family toxin of toxin-antitoxin system